MRKISFENEIYFWLFSSFIASSFLCLFLVVWSNGERTQLLMKPDTTFVSGLFRILRPSTFRNWNWIFLPKNETYFTQQQKFSSHTNGFVFSSRLDLSIDLSPWHLEYFRLSLLFPNFLWAQNCFIKYSIHRFVRF